jgi:chromate transporter
MKKHLEIFLAMMKIGLFTFGGGYAMIALLESEFVSKKKWLSREEFLDMVAISESTPGPIAINAATYIGYKTRGLLGALLATVGVIIPSFIIIYAISLFFDAFLSIALVAKAFRGIQVAVVYLILSAGIKLLRGMKKTVLSVFILSATVLFMLLFSVFAIRFSTVLYILIAGAIGVSLYLIQALRKREGAAK